MQATEWFFLAGLMVPAGFSGEALLSLLPGKTWKAQVLQAYMQNEGEQVQRRNMKLITVWCSARLCTLSCKQIKSRILSLVWVEVQDLDFYKYPADS